MSLCQTFRNLSYKTWMQLGKARQVKHQMLEESITDLLMVELKSQNPYEIITKTFTRKQEGKNGADWEWWFVDSSGKKGIGFRVQAKIINFQSNSFEQLHYLKTSKTKGKVYQTDLLIQEARRKHLIPLYCLYIHDENIWSSVKDPVKFALNNLLFPCSSVEHLGCSILSTKVVKNLKASNQRHLKDVVNHIYPWHFLVCPPSLKGSNLDLPNKVLGCVTEHDLLEDQDDADTHYRELPDYVKNMINQSYENSSNDSEFIDEEGEFDSDLRGIMIIKDKRD